MVSLNVPQSPSAAFTGLRPINLRTDLVPLADLIELAFADTMDSSGRSAIQEMRSLSKFGVGLNMFAGMNELAQGISMGYVWIEDGRLVGNVSVYPTNWPKNLGKTWIIANVAVHPDYRQRGIAGRLMEAAMTMIRNGHGARAILQVDTDNDVARHLYQRLGFVEERTWVTWRRNRRGRMLEPVPDYEAPLISYRGLRDWEAEYALAQRLRPADQGGLGWMRPLHPTLFRPSLWKRLTEWMSLHTLERLIIRGAGESLVGSMWLERQLGASTVQITLMVDPAYQGTYDDALIRTAVRRYGMTENLMLEHPADDESVTPLLQRYQFEARRTVTHMRWDI